MPNTTTTSSKQLRVPKIKNRPIEHRRRNGSNFFYQPLDRPATGGPVDLELDVARARVIIDVVARNRPEEALKVLDAVTHMRAD